MSVLDVQKAIRNAMAQLALGRPQAAVELDDRIDFGRPDLEAQVAVHGFGPPEGGGRWTIGSSAGFVFNPMSERHTVMELELQPFVTGRPGRSLHLQCGDGQVHEIRFATADQSVITIAIPIEHRTRAAALRTRLSLPDATSSGQFESELDRRSLGVFLRSLRLRRLETLQLGQRVAVGADETTGLAMSCFGQAEPSGRWTLGQTSWLVCRAPDKAGANLRMFVDLTPLVTPTHGQSMRVSNDAGMERAFRFPAGRRRRTTISFPIARRNSDSLSLIRFRLQDPKSPHELGLGQDRRPLGVQVHEVRIERDTRFAAAKEYWKHRVKRAISSENKPEA